MSFFEEIAQTKQPFAAVDNAPVLSYAEIEESFDALVEDGIKKWARAIYDHWRERRMKKGNRPLQPQLKVRGFRHRIEAVGGILTARSSKPARKRMTRIHMYASVEERFARPARLVVGTRKVPRSSEDCGKSLKMHGNCLRLCGNASWPARKCSTSRSRFSFSGRRSRR